MGRPLGGGPGRLAAHISGMISDDRDIVEVMGAGGRFGRALLSTVMITLVLGALGCTRWEGGQAVPGEAAGPLSTRPSVPPRSLPSLTPSSGVTNPPATSAALVPNVVEDECLLDGAGFSALAGLATGPGQNTVLGSGDQDRGRSCFYFTEGARDPVGRIDVLGTDGTPPGEVVARVMGRGNHAIFRVGQGAVVLDEVGAPGAEMYTATDRYLIQIHLDQVKPTDDRWAAAGRAAITRLGA